MTSIKIPSSVTSIGYVAFAYCSSLTSITVDENNQNYKSIDGNLYSKDGKTLIQYAIGKTATSFSIPDGVTSIGSRAFYGCSGLTSIVIPSSVTSIDRDAFSSCDGLTSVTFLENSQLNSIGNRAFYGCSGLTSIELPSNVTNIGRDAFEGCGKLTSITFKNTSGWWYSSSSSATSGTAISSSDLSNASTAATYLTSTYRSYYWKRA